MQSPKQVRWRIARLPDYGEVMREVLCIAAMITGLGGCGEANPPPPRTATAPPKLERFDDSRRFRSVDDGTRIDVELGPVIRVAFPDLNETVPDLKVPELTGWKIQNVIVRKVDPVGCVIIASGMDGTETRCASFTYLEGKGWTWGPIHLGTEGRAGRWKPLDARVGGDRLTATFGRVDGLSISLRLYTHDCLSRFSLQSKHGDLGQLFHAPDQGGTLIEIPRSELDPD